jgi:uncharacterized repeat protein (TIGR01451 family)
MYSGTGISAIDTTYGSPAINSWKATGGWPASGAANPASPYFEFTLDTSNFNTASGINLNYNYMLRGNWANGANNHVYTYASTNGGTSFSNLGDILDPSKNNWLASPNYQILPSGAATTIFRINAVGQQQPTAALFLDSLIFTGCGVAAPPTITKSFAPNPIAVNGISTLTFTLSNENNVPLTGVKFIDQLPAGVKVAATPNASTTCLNTAPPQPTWVPASNDTLLTFGSPTGATIPARSGTTNGSCTVRVDVTATTAGPHNNISGNISSAESGTNNGPGGTASATLTAILPPQIAKSFAPDPIVAGGTSTLTFTITNPNTDYALTGLAFTDTFPTSPGLMTVANPLTTTNTCGGSLLDNAGGTLAAGDPGIQLTGGNISGGQSCSVSVNITAPANGSYSNTSGNVSAAVAGNGNTASDILNVVPTRPAISLLKQISTSPTGPWSSNLGVTVGTNIYYRFTVENIGDVSLSGVGVTDPTLGALPGCSWANMPVFDLQFCDFGPVAAVSGTHANTATATGTPPSGPNVSDTSTATYATAGLTLVKSAQETTYAAAGDVLHYSYLVTNSGLVSLLKPLSVSDDKATDETCPDINTVGDLDDFLDPGENITCSATYTVNAGDVTNKFVTNNASASIDGVTSNTDTETITYLAPPTVTKAFLPATIVTGGTSTLLITINNSGGTDLTNVTFTDT